MPANPIDLSSLNAVKLWGGINVDKTTGLVNPGVDDVKIQDALTAFSMTWLQELSAGEASGEPPAASPFNSVVRFVENYDGNGSDRLYTYNRPIQGVNSLLINNVIQQLSTSYALPGYVIDKEKASIQLRGGGGGTSPAFFSPGFPVFGIGAYFQKGVQNIALDYNAGFNPQSIANELRTIPTTGSPQITVNVQPWFSDAGVKFFSGGAPLTQVFLAPAAGEYYVVSPGVYLFSSADVGAQVLISYTATGVPFDIEQAVKIAVNVNYVRTQWIDLKSKAMAQGAGTTSFRDWVPAAEVWKVIENYKRYALA